MKNLHTLLEKSNMRPRERVFILVKHEAHELKTGEAILDTLDIRGLTRVWKPEGNHEIREYNRYLNFWNSFKLLDVDIQTLYFCLQLNIANIDKLLLAYCHQEDTQKLEKVLRKVYGEKEDNFQLEYVLKNTGLEYNMLIHKYTFSLLPEKLKRDLELIDPYMGHEPNYLNQEEQLASIVSGKKELSKKDITALVRIIYDSISWDHVDFIEERGLCSAEFIFRGYFASCPMILFAEKIAERYGFVYEEDKEMLSQVSKISDLKNKTRDAIRDTLEDGLFIDEFIPLCNDVSREVDDGKISQPLNKMFSAWIKEKQQVEAKIQGLIDAGILKLQNRTETLFDRRLSKKIITGESLYYADSTYPFVKDFKKQAKQLMVYAFLYRLFEGSNLMDQYGQLLRFKEISERASIILDEDLTEPANRYISKIDELVAETNKFIQHIRCNVEDVIFMEFACKYHIETFFDGLKIQTDKAQSQGHRSLEIFEEKAVQYLNKEWSSFDESDELVD